MSIPRLVITLTGLLVVSGASADGVFVSVGLPNVSIDGDFDGDAIFSGGGSSEIVPSFSASNGISLAFGILADNLMMSGSYMQADLDGDWRGLSAPAAYWALTGELAYLFRLNTRLNPYLLGGMGISSVSVKDGSTDGSGFSNARFESGLQWRIGGGVLVDLSDRLNIDLQAVKLLGEYDTLDGIADGKLQGFSSDGAVYSVAVQYLFGRRKSN